MNYFMNLCNITRNELSYIDIYYFANRNLFFMYKPDRWIYDEQIWYGIGMRELWLFFFFFWFYKLCETCYQTDSRIECCNEYQKNVNCKPQRITKNKKMKFSSMIRDSSSLSTYTILFLWCQNRKLRCKHWFSTKSLTESNDRAPLSKTLI